jgi:hypothetical protein
MRALQIYPADWIEFQPYKNSGATDVFYAKVANKIYNYLIASDFNVYHSGLKKLSIRMAMLLEDIVSQNGIWAAVVEEFEKRYGYTLPFYAPGPDYQKGYLNVEDVKLKLWSEIQAVGYYNLFIDPEKKWLNNAAEDIFQILDAEWETAPENTRKHDFIFNKETALDYGKARELFEWFVTKSLVSEMFEPELNYRMYSLYGDAGERKLQFGNDAAKYFVMTDMIFTDRHNILNFCASKWMARIRKDEKDIWENFKNNDFSYYQYLRENDTQIIFRDLVNETEIPIEKDSLSEGLLRKKVKPEYYNFGAVEFRGKFYQVGMLRSGDKIDSFARELEHRKNMYEIKKSYKGIHELILKHTGGKDMVFFKDKHELTKFYEDAGVQNFKKPDIGEKIVLISFDYSNSAIYYGDYVRCINSPDNPFYDREFAKKNTIKILTDNYSSDYSTVEYLLRHNCLTDGHIAEKDDNDFINKYSGFIVDYFHASTREYDL